LLFLPISIGGKKKKTEKEKEKEKGVQYCSSLIVCVMRLCAGSVPPRIHTRVDDVPRCCTCCMHAAGPAETCVGRTAAR
jgi:hypothetical protein